MANWNVRVRVRVGRKQGKVIVLVHNQPNEKAAKEVALEVAEQEAAWDEVMDVTAKKIWPKKKPKPFKPAYTLLTPAGLAKLLYEGLEKDDWGDIDPYVIKRAADDPESSSLDDADKSMRKILEDVVAELRKNYTLG